MSLILIILYVVLLDYLICFFYCLLRNRYCISVDKILSDNSSNQSLDNKNLIRRGKITSQLVKWLDSLLRFTVFFTGYIPSHSIRLLIYKFVFKVHVGKHVVIYYGAEIRSPWNLYIDEGAVIGDRAILDARSGIYIGKNVNISTGVWIWTLQHDVNSSDFSTKGENKPVVIKDRAWVSCRAVILPGVTIDEGTIIAAGGVVTKATEKYSIYGGVPCKKIGTRNTELNYNFEGNRYHFI